MDPDRPKLMFGCAAWWVFAYRLKANEFDLVIGVSP
ncbi:hypothetical protein ETD83_04755 [Actinomadura soli]|uniref:Uncharacterized protein n=1 Tax=Actinomadura soli TaxID=2508997 RepID=A0A5C4JJ82_9ACTN|nr:hypothetical protein ETD83_04755 [Actinomadura soli]